MQSGNAFKVSPRFGFVYDLTGQGRTIVRGGGGILYDRPMGNIVFDMGGNAPSVLNSTLQWGLLQNLGAAGGDPASPLGMAPTAYDFNPPKVYSWNIGVQHKLASKLILDIAYVGSSSKNLLRKSNINAPALGATFQPEEPGPDAARELQRELRAAHRPPAALPGLRRHQPVRLLGLLQLPLAADVAAAAVRQRVHVHGLLRLEQGPHDQHLGLHFRRRGRGHRGRPGHDQEVRLLVFELGPPAQLRGQLHLPDAQGDGERPEVAGERLADLGRLPPVERPALCDQLLDPRRRERQPERHQQPGRAHRPHLRPG